LTLARPCTQLKGGKLAGASVCLVCDTLPVVCLGGPRGLSQCCLSVVCVCCCAWLRQQCSRCVQCTLFVQVMMLVLCNRRSLGVVCVGVARTLYCDRASLCVACGVCSARRHVCRRCGGMAQRACRSVACIALSGRLQLAYSVHCDMSCNELSRARPGAGSDESFGASYLPTCLTQAAPDVWLQSATHRRTPHSGHANPWWGCWTGV
jgi:hypothetical protein